MVRAAINLIPEHPIRRMVELATRAESQGYERCWVYDEGLATRDVYVTLAAIAQATQRLQLGPGITNPYTRHIATTAAAVASIDELSGGRGFLGIGAGGSLTLDPLGIERERPLSHVRDGIAATRALFSGGPTNLVTPTVSLVAAELGYARSDIEIWLAGRGPKMLGLGGERCDGVMLDFIHKASLQATLDLVRDGARRGANAPALSYSTMIITNDRAMAATKPHMTYRLVDSPPSVKEAIGLSDGDADVIRRAMADGLEAAAEHVREEWILPFVIAGTVEECASELADLFDQHGIDEFLLPVLDDSSAEESIDTVAHVLQLG